MLGTDEDAVICDFAETYHVLDIGALDLRLAATLAAGLAPDSRINMRMRGDTQSSDVFLKAAMVDNLSMIRWMMSKDGADGINRPVSILAALTETTEDDDGMKTFTSPEAFQNAWAGLTAEEGE